MTAEMQRMKQQMRAALDASSMNPSHGFMKYALGLAQVVSINTAEHAVELKILTGQQDEFQRTPVTLTHPAAGARHYIGAMPQVGDLCIVGYMNQESSGGTPIPVVLRWVGPSPWMGYDWNPSQPFSPLEVDFSTKTAIGLDGIFHRRRHKMKAMDPGNILLSSAQGADLSLDEGVLIANRRGNEIHLRDSDQNMIFRSVSQHHALSGARSYHGPVQRDARLLPAQMFDTGTQWAASRQVDESGNSLTEDQLPDTENDIKGALTPADVFLRGEGDFLPTSGIDFLNAASDPYTILQRGLVIDADGFALNLDEQLSDAVYGGKSIYRISQDIGPDGLPLNAELGDTQSGRSLSELRWEIAHTSDGRLPVTEQTDGFDADRLPGAQGDINNPINASSSYIEFVMGSVVGNDPYSTEGINQYGIPLKFSIVDSDNKVAPSVDNAIGTPINEHAATMFRIQPPFDTTAAPTFWGAQKNGVLKASLGGPRNVPWSAEIASTSGLFLSSQRNIRLQPTEGFQVRSNRGPEDTNLGIDLHSESGAVKIYGGGKSAEGRLGRQNPEVGGGSADQPSVHIEGKGDIVLKAGRKLRLSASSFDFGNTASTKIAATSVVDIQSGDKIRMTSKTVDKTVFGKETETFAGPKDFLPTNLPIRTEQFIANPATGHVGGLTDQYNMLLGDRVETILAGNHVTTVAVGSATYQVVGGVWSAGAGLNRIAIDSATGINAITPVGNITMTSATGAIALTSTLSARIFSSGVTTVTGVAGVALGGPGKIGFIVSSSDLDPLTGLPLATFLMGSPGHSLVAPV
jgi:hypothetical protein